MYPDRLREALQKIAGCRDALKDKRGLLHSLEVNITATITTQKDPTSGKLLLSNETQRTAAVRKSVDDDDDCRTLAAEIRDLERQLVDAEIEAECLRHEIRYDLLECEQRNHLAALKVADSIYFARFTAIQPAPYTNGHTEPDEIQLPF